MTSKELLNKFSLKKVIIVTLLFAFAIYFSVFLLFLKTQKVSLFSAVNLTFIKGYHSAMLENPKVFFKTMIPGTLENTLLKEHLATPAEERETNYSVDKGSLASGPLPYEMFYEFMTNTDQNSPRDWHWRNDMVVGQVLSWDSKRELLGLAVTIPDPRVQSWSSDKSTFKVECEKKDSIIVGESLSLKTTFIDFLDELEDGDRVYAFCLNKDCSAIGKSCVIARNDK